MTWTHRDALSHLVGYAAAAIAVEIETKSFNSQVCSASHLSSLDSVGALTPAEHICWLLLALGDQGKLVALASPYIARGTGIFGSKIASFGCCCSDERGHSGTSASRRWGAPYLDSRVSARHCHR
jgi:hypothetical protein